jgi:transcriptional regulator with XRE-family HTH domain
VASANKTGRRGGGRTGAETARGASPLGERLRAERDRLGLSLRELARRLEVSPSLVSQIETGKIQPSVRTLYAIVTELGVSLDELFAPPAGAGPGSPAAPAR